MCYVRKNLRASYAVHDDRYVVSLKAANLAFLGPQYIEDEAGYRIRVWGDGSVDWVKDEDVRAWLIGNRVIEDLTSGLEYVRDSYVKVVVRDGYLRKDPKAAYYWVTRKAAERFNLPRVMGCEFPK